MARTGRRPGTPDTREQILTAARTAFGEFGYDRVTVRAVAASAGVDPALVHHYFGTKDKLFLASVAAPVDPGEIIPAALAGDRAGTGERLVRNLLRIWDDPVSGAAALALFRSAVSHDWLARMMREFLVARVLRPLVREVAADQPDLRAALVASQMMGLIGTRYLLRLEPLASAEPETVVRAIGPTVQRYLTEPQLPPER